MWLPRLLATIPRYLAVRRRRARHRQHAGLPVTLLSDEDGRVLDYALGVAYSDTAVRSVFGLLCRQAVR